MNDDSSSPYLCKITIQNLINTNKNTHTKSSIHFCTKIQRVGLFYQIYCKL